MSILKEIKRLFGVKGASIEEALKNVDSIGGGSGSGGVEIVEATPDGQNALVLNKTYNEIEQMVSEKKVIYVYFTHRGIFSQNYTYEPVVGVYKASENQCYVETICNDIGSYKSKNYIASSSDGYPSFNQDTDAPLG